jgi:transposase
MALVLARVSNRNQAKKLIPHFINAIEILKESGFKHMKTLGETIEKWQEEIVRMWRFSKTNGITEGFHNKMEEILRRAYGMRNFENFRLHVLETCT